MNENVKLYGGYMTERIEMRLSQFGWFYYGSSYYS